ncbi:MAG: hypothetical protein EBR93_04585, partial [Bacteroidetes bacterium]|nr:hypothetical protein [Bacteroidota bacterium]
EEIRGYVKRHVGVIESDGGRRGGGGEREREMERQKGIGNTCDAKINNRFKPQFASAMLSMYFRIHVALPTMQHMQMLWMVLIPLSIKWVCVDCTCPTGSTNMLDKRADMTCGSTGQNSEYCRCSPVSGVTVKDISLPSYRDNMRCYWIIKTYEAQSINVVIYEPSITEYYYDYIAVQECLTPDCADTQELWRWSGDVGQIENTANTNHIKIIFWSDSSNYRTSSVIYQFYLRWFSGFDEVRCVCDAGYAGDPCLPCSGGTFKDTTGSQSCLTCDANFYSESSSASTHCLECPSNSNSVSGSDEVSDCKCWANFYLKSSSTSTHCLECPSNSYSMSGSDEVSDCKCGANFYLESSSTSTYCLECPSNSYSVSGSDEVSDCVCGNGYSGPAGGPCILCGVGKFFNTDELCESCPMGKYKSFEGPGVCSSCLTNASTASIGSTSMYDCKCNAGYTGNNGGPCQACVAGTYKSALGSEVCQLCPEDSDTDDVSGSTLISFCKCNIGYTGPDGGPCLACEIGKYKTVVGSHDCTSCPDFTNTPSTGSVAKIDCQCNTGYSGFDADKCTPCDPNTYKDTLGSDACSACPVHSVSGYGQTVCVCIDNSEDSDLLTPTYFPSSDRNIHKARFYFRMPGVSAIYYH